MRLESVETSIRPTTWFRCLLNLGGRPQRPSTQRLHYIEEDGQHVCLEYRPCSASEASGDAIVAAPDLSATVRNKLERRGSQPESTGFTSSWNYIDRFSPEDRFGCCEVPLLRLSFVFIVKPERVQLQLT